MGPVRTATHSQVPSCKFSVQSRDRGCRIRAKGEPYLPQPLSRPEGTPSFLILTKNPAQYACLYRVWAYGKRGSHLEGWDYAGSEGGPGVSDRKWTALILGEVFLGHPIS